MPKAQLPSGLGRSCVFDLEGNGLLHELNTIHCIVAIDVKTKEVFDWRPWEVEDGLKFLAECDHLIGHNIVDYDLRAIRKLRPGWKFETAFQKRRVSDTLIFCKMIWPYDTLYVRDAQLVREGRLEPKLLKSHSLKAWGQRLKNHKADYTGPWDVWSQEMHDYMIQDAKVNVDLWELILQRIGWVEQPEPDTYVWPELPFDIEHAAAAILADQETFGVNFDRDAAVLLAQELMNAKADLEERLIEHFGSWWQPLDDPKTGKIIDKDRREKLTQFPDVRLPRFSEKTGKQLSDYVGPPICTYTANAPFVRIKRVTFSPSSRDHLGQRLQAVYGWKPKKFGSNGKPTVDESTLQEIPGDLMPEYVRKMLLDFFVINKTLGQLSAGRKSWLVFCDGDGRIHGRVDPVGAITSRGTHRDPNMGQVPSVTVEEIKDENGKKIGKKIVFGIEGGFGYECRSLFIASKGNEMTGSDTSSLELLCLGHYLQPFDGGVFVDRMSDPTRDPHTEHGEITGESRADTKTVTYLYVYGGGAEKAGQGLTPPTPEEVPALLKYRPLSGLLQWKKKIEGDDYTEPTDFEKARLAKGHRVLKAFETKIPGLKDLKDSVTEIAKERKWLKAIDGRKLYVRKAHAALNTLLQGAGAIICKLWMVLIDKRLRAAGIKAEISFTLNPDGTYTLKAQSGPHVAQTLWVHDELQFDHTPGLGETIAKFSEEAIKEAGEILGFRGVLRTDSKTGKSWAETH